MKNRSAIFALFVFALGWFGTNISTLAQEVEPSLKNGNLETATSEGMPTEWKLEAVNGFQYSLDSEDPYEGKTSLLIDSMAMTNDAEKMVASGTQEFSAKPWQGKRVKLTAAVRTENLRGPARMQLFVRDSVRGPGLMGSFNPTIRIADEMIDRPIRNSEWQKYEIVVDIADEAKKVFVGWKMIGVGQGWIDDISLTEVSADVPLTNPEKVDDSEPEEDYSDIMPLIQKASLKAHLEPQQPFFNHWLWLVLIALGLFGISYLPPRTPAEQPELLERPDDNPPSLGLVKKFAFRFTVIYWVLFLFTVPFESEFSKVSKWAIEYYKPVSEYLINSLATNLFKIEEELTPPLGSGDTTYSYLHVLARFLVSLVLAVVWSLVDWRKTDYRISKDLFNSYLRYALAAALMVYGLIKVKWSSNQFPEIREYSLDRTWGETSPMGVVWNFMGASRPYTVFAGMGEIAGGLLLIFRRTYILGAMVAVGVMSNVVMLNFCFDVPVKILSVHLTVMGLMLLLGASGTLGALIFLKPSQQSSLKPPYYGPRSRWVYFPIKAGLVIVGFLLPCWFHTFQEVEYLQNQAALPKWLDEYTVKEFKLDGDPVDSETHKTRWKTATFSEVNRWSNVGENATCQLSLDVRNRMMPSTGFSSVDTEELNFDPSEFPTFPQGKCSVSIVDEKTISLNGVSLAGEVEIVLRKKRKKKRLLKERGFRWVSEVPFNR